MNTEKTKEKEIEDKLIQKLQDLKYNYRPDIRDRNSLEANFRKKFQELNRVKLTDNEFARLQEEIIQPDVFEASIKLRQTNTFQREDGTPLQYTLVNIKEWCKNDFEVINQLKINTKNSFHRYDVILLINGIPVVQIELKTLGKSHRVAMQQIVDYKNDPGNGYSNTLLCYMQLFIVSNQTDTYYFANNRNEHFAFDGNEQFLPVYQLANEKNEAIAGLFQFADKFLAKCTLGEMISRYMVLVKTEHQILVMRPYQVYAVKAIVDCITENRGNGYIWHTTGSGKTLTSFKASTLLKDNEDIHKCLFVVDRKDLDRQTREEFNKFQENCVEENTNTASLVERLKSDSATDKVIVTTIQKLGIALDPTHKRNYKKQLEDLGNKRVVFIFDECHRSQFGENHKTIKEFFPKAQLFGFTGTPIFQENSTSKTIEGEVATFKTTEDIFQKELHAYTITHAIEQRNVLKFHIDYFKEKEDEKKDKKAGIKTKIPKKAIAKAIIEKHDAATHNRKYNAVLATASINDAIEYYHLFKEIQENRMQTDEDFKPLQLACVFSPPAEGNKDIKQLQDDLTQEKADNEVEPDVKKEALKTIIDDYNKQYGTNHRIAEFDKYYQDVQKRIKSQKYSNKDVAHSKKIDVTLVVDMLLTGFDSKYLNTLYVDKNLKHHGLIQAFSRTNRILNSTKPYGNILDFRKQRDAVDDAIALFSGGESEGEKKVWLVDPAPKVMEEFKAAVKNFENFMESEDLECVPEEATKLKGDSSRCQFITAFKEVKRLRTQLEQYTDLGEENKETIEELIPEDDMRAFTGVYLETAKQLKTKQEKLGDKASPEIQELDFELVLFDSAIIDYDYIMGLMAKLTQKGPKKQKMTRAQLIAMLSSSANLMDEREDITEFINNFDSNTVKTVKEIHEEYQAFKNEKLLKTYKKIGKKHGLEAAAIKEFVEEIIDRMIFDSELLSDLLEPLNLGWKTRTKKENELMQDLIPELKKLAKGQEISGLDVYE